MELLKRRGRLSEPEVQYYMIQLLDAVHYMHSNNIIHRDLKLGNIFLNSNMEVKVGDLGLAAQLSHSEERKRTVCGTPNYIAPEILEGHSTGHSFEVDTWSLGVILYTMLVGKPPFETQDVKTTYRRIRNNVYSFPPTVPVSEAAKSLVRAILTKDPKARPKIPEILRHRFFTGAGVRIPKRMPSESLHTPPMLRDSDMVPGVSIVDDILTKPVGGLLTRKQRAEAAAAVVNGLEGPTFGEYDPKAPQQAAKTDAAAKPADIKVAAAMHRRPLTAIATNGQDTAAPKQEETKPSKPMKPASGWEAPALEKPATRYEFHTMASKAREQGGISPSENVRSEAPAKPEALPRAYSARVPSPRSEEEAADVDMEGGSSGGRKESVRTAWGVAPSHSKKTAGMEPDSLNAAPEKEYPVAKAGSSEEECEARTPSGASPAGDGMVDTVKAMHARLSSSFATKGGPKPSAMAFEEEVPEAPGTSVEIWVDYTSKYGLGYLMKDGSVGVYFNDSTKIILASNNENFEYIERNSRKQTGSRDIVRNAHLLSDYPADLKKKVTLLKHFRDYLVRIPLCYCCCTVLLTRFSLVLCFSSSDWSVQKENAHC